MTEEQLNKFRQCYIKAEEFISAKREAYKSHERNLEIMTLAKIFYDISKDN